MAWNNILSHAQIALLGITCMSKFSNAQPHLYITYGSPPPLPLGVKVGKSSINRICKSIMMLYSCPGSRQELFFSLRGFHSFTFYIQNSYYLLLFYFTIKDCRPNSRKLVFLFLFLKEHFF